jgi:ssDNA-binding Zn-finger/Zn-ribbon topoisomerase 1
MSDFLEEYLDRGLSEIYITGHEEHEESGGFQNEYTTEYVVAKKEKKYVRIELREKKDFSPRGGRSVGIVSEQEISEETYKKAAQQNVAIDTPVARKAVSEIKDKRRRRWEAEEKIQELAPTCPDHQIKLEQKSGKFGPFWGCPQFPACSYTANFTREAKQIYEQLRRGEFS